jgi:DNA-binding LacI/PurR family transcriptional regulator
MIKAIQNTPRALNRDAFDFKRGLHRGVRRPVADSNPNRRPGPIRIALATVGQHPETRRTLRLPVINAVIESIIRTAKQNGARVFLEELPTLADVTRLLLSNQADGAIVLLTAAPMDALAEIDPHLPIVWALGGQAGPMHVDHVSTNNLAVGYLAHQYLYQRGCKNIASLTADANQRYAQQRRMALAGAAAELGHRSTAFIVSDDHHSADLYGRNTVACPTLPQLLDAFARISPRPDGLFIDRDATTAHVYPLLRQRSIEPGRDLIVCSCDNEEVRLSSLAPRPATIDLGTEEMGFRAVHRLLLRIAGPHEPPVFIQSMPYLVEGTDQKPAEP